MCDALHGHISYLSSLKYMVDPYHFPTTFLGYMLWAYDRSKGGYTVYTHQTWMFKVDLTHTFGVHMLWSFNERSYTPPDFNVA